MVIFRGLRNPLAQPVQVSHRKSISYRPVEVAIAMVFQERSPNQDIRDFHVLGHFIGVRLSWAHSAELAFATYGTASCGRGIEGTNRVEDMGEVRCSGSDLACDVLVTVIEDLVCSMALDEIVVLRTASREDFQPLKFRELDGVLSDTCCSMVSGCDLENCFCPSYSCRPKSARFALCLDVEYPRQIWKRVRATPS